MTHFCLPEKILEMDEKERYPNFRALMKIIESHMTADGVSIPVAEDLKEVCIQDLVALENSTWCQYSFKVKLFQY